MKTTLYRRNNYGQPYMWSISVIGEHELLIEHGILGKSLLTEKIKSDNPIQECNSKIKAKRKTGYKLLSELKDDYVSSPIERNIQQLINYLNTYLPDNRTTEDGNLLPMLAKSFKPGNTTFKKCSLYLGQYKINGLRCLIKAEANQGDMFKPYKLTFQSREGTMWNSLSNLEEYLLSVLEESFIKRMIDEHIALDGELYLPGYSVNDINHFVKDATCEQNKLIQFWCYDLAMEDTMYNNRSIILDKYLEDFTEHIIHKDDHLNNNKRLVRLQDYIVASEDIAIKLRNRFISMGFEGVILRNPYEEYQFGKRNSAMFKYKDRTDAICKIIDIYPESKRTNIPILLCLNDINDATFECHITGSFDYQATILMNKDKYIGSNVKVEFGERSGINEVPFHILTVKLV